MNEKNKITFACDPCCSGDVICLISAAHTYARVTGNHTYINRCQDIVDSYNDGILSFGQEGEVKQLFSQIWDLHRNKQPCHDHYLHTFLSLMLPDTFDHYGFDLPRFPEEPKRCLIQPWSVTAENPSDAYLQSIVDNFVALTGKELFCIGLPQTKRHLKNINFSLLEESLPAMMAHIQNAEMLLTPRSCSAHIGAGYGVKTFVWMPNDNENWHLNYPNWDATKVLLKTDIEESLSALRDFIKGSF